MSNRLAEYAPCTFAVRCGSSPSVALFIITGSITTAASTSAMLTLGQDIGQMKDAGRFEYYASLPMNISPMIIIVFLLAGYFLAGLWAFIGFFSRDGQMAGPDSDIDILVIKARPFGPDDDRRQEMIRLWRALARFPVPKDILVVSRQEVERRKSSRMRPSGSMRDRLQRRPSGRGWQCCTLNTLERMIFQCSSLLLKFKNKTLPLSLTSLNSIPMPSSIAMRHSKTWELTLIVSW